MSGVSFLSTKIKLVKLTNLFKALQYKALIIALTLVISGVAIMAVSESLSWMPESVSRAVILLTDSGLSLPEATGVISQIVHANH